MEHNYAKNPPGELEVEIAARNVKKRGIKI